MSTILKVDKSGSLNVPAAVLPVKEPFTSYVASLYGEQLVLAPMASEKPFWLQASTAEWMNSFNAWVASLEPGPGLPDEAVARESMYD